MISALLNFNGERIDITTGVTHLNCGYRAYNPALFRFHTPDSWSPFGAGGINAYGYCANDPVNRSDPSGHMSWQSIIGITLGVTGILGSVITGGASLVAAGSLTAALAGTSAATLMITAASLLSGATGIASLAINASHPEASAILGWVSLATGTIALGAGLVSGSARLIRAGQRLAGAFDRGLSPMGASVSRAAQAVATASDEEAPSILSSEFRQMQANYERNALNQAIRRNLPMLKRRLVGSHPIIELGRHLRKITLRPGLSLPAYSRDLQLIAPLNPDFDIMLHRAYTTFNIPPSAFDFRFVPEVLPSYSEIDEVSGLALAEQQRIPPSYASLSEQSAPPHYSMTAEYYNEEDEITRL